MKVLITGSSGFIGSNAVEFFKNCGQEICQVDVMNEAGPIDILNLKSLSAVFSKHEPDAVIHLAALASVPLAEDNPFEAYNTNVIGTLNVVDCSNRFGAKVILASSAAVYGEPMILPTPENAPLSPVNLYGATKVAAEQLVSLRAKEWLILRLFNVYGPKCNRSYVIPDTIRQVIHGKNPIQLLGTGNERRDFVYIDDVMRALMLGIKNDVSGAFNIGSGQTVSIGDLVTKILEIEGAEAQFSFVGSKRVGDFSVNWSDVSKAKRELGWEPTIQLEEGLSKTTLWFKNHAYK